MFNNGWMYISKELICFIFDNSLMNLSSIAKN